jgi:hypothetical protein
MNVYTAESTLLRVQKLEKLRGDEKNGLYKDILEVTIYDVAHLIKKAGTDAVNSFATGNEHRIWLERIERFTTVPPVNIKEARLRIANELLEENRYFL